MSQKLTDEEAFCNCMIPDQVECEKLEHLPKDCYYRFKIEMQRVNEEKETTS